jgi:hypothetical protein
LAESVIFLTGNPSKISLSSPRKEMPFITVFFAFCYAYIISLAGKHSTISTIIALLFPTLTNLFCRNDKHSTIITTIIALLFPTLGSLFCRNMLYSALLLLPCQVLKIVHFKRKLRHPG